MDEGHQQGPSSRGSDSIGHRVDQLPQRVRCLAAVWRLQAIRLGSRDGWGGACELHGGQGGYDEALRATYESLAMLRHRAGLHVWLVQPRFNTSYVRKQH